MVQQTVRDYYMQQLLPVMEQVFDANSDEEETIIIDTLQIDLGNILSQGISINKWREEILSGIKEQLCEKINMKKENPASHEPRALSVCQQWLHYMEKGYLPWNAFNVNETWYQLVLEALATEYTMVSKLRLLILNHPEVSKRIVLQHPETFSVTLIEIITAEKQTELPAAVVALHKMLLDAEQTDSSSISPSSLKQNIWQHIIQTAVDRGGETKSIQLIESAILHFLRDISVLKRVVENNASEFQTIIPILKRLQESPEKFIIKQLTLNQMKKKTSEEENRRKVQAPVGEEGIYVQHAGAVLLHAFLPTLLNRLQWISNGKFKNDIDHQKALYLIHFIATGKAIAEEHELAIPKILCEWNLKKTVDKEIELTGAELSEAENMMHAAIEQWVVLKATSIEGLREGFLKRSGKLYSKNNNLMLQVESSSIDVLLDQLPWNLSIVKLPWMKEILRVEWR